MRLSTKDGGRIAVIGVAFMGVATLWLNSGTEGATNSTPPRHQGHVATQNPEPGGSISARAVDDANLGLTPVDVTPAEPAHLRPESLGFPAPQPRRTGASVPIAEAPDARRQVQVSLETLQDDVAAVQARVEASGVGPEVHAALAEHRSRLDEVLASQASPQQ